MNTVGSLWYATPPTLPLALQDQVAAATPRRGRRQWGRQCQLPLPLRPHCRVRAPRRRRRWKPSCPLCHQWRHGRKMMPRQCLPFIQPPVQKVHLPLVWPPLRMPLLRPRPRHLQRRAQLHAPLHLALPARLTARHAPSTCLPAARHLARPATRHRRAASRRTRCGRRREPSDHPHMHTPSCSGQPAWCRRPCRGLASLRTMALTAMRTAGASSRRR